MPNNEDLKTADSGRPGCDRGSWSTLAQEPGTYVDAALSQRHSDLLFSIRGLGGEPLLLYLLVEHQSEADAWMPLRLHGYVDRIWQRWRAADPSATRLPRVVGRAEGRTEGRAEGRTEGRAEGRTEGRAEMRLLLLGNRFGPLDAATQERIRAASFAELEQWAVRMLTAPTLVDVLG
ncbi:MAG: Rpn family recombination-promoting nuclease/putative transposase [Polyangiaceae bacterium]